MPDYFVAVRWAMAAVLVVTAATPEEAAEKGAMAEDPLPEGDYVEGSFFVYDVTPAP